MTNTALDDVARLERQVAELTDRAEITNLVYRLGAFLDDRRFDEMRSLLVETATVRRVGRDQILSQADREEDERTYALLPTTARRHRSSGAAT